MASRRDQLQSYQFQTQRVLSAFVMRETDPAQSPLRRGVGAVFTGLMVAVMVGAGFGVYGLLTKVGSTTWKTDGAVVVEKETGASFFYQDGELHPMLNYTSALLATGTSSRQVFQESANALDGVPRDIMRGIPYAPNSLPDESHLAGAPWTVCSTPSTDTRTIKGPVSTLAVGTHPSGGTELDNRGVLVRDTNSGAIYLVWHGARYKVTSTDVETELFGVANPVMVATAWINAMPAGGDIGPINIPSDGNPSAAVPKYNNGQLLESQVGSGGVQYYLVFDNGIAAITPMQKTIVSNQQGATQAIEVKASTVAQYPPSYQVAPDAQVPQPTQTPSVVATKQTDGFCATFTGPTGMPTVTWNPTIPAGGAPTPGRTSTGTALADQIQVPAGHIAVVKVTTPANAIAGGYYLVTDLGMRYAVTSKATLQALGYQDTDAVPMPGDLLQLIPSGPTLSTSAAMNAAANAPTN